MAFLFILICIIFPSALTIFPISPLKCTFISYTEYYTDRYLCMYFGSSMIIRTYVRSMSERNHIIKYMYVHVMYHTLFNPFQKL